MGVHGNDEVEEEDGDDEDVEDVEEDGEAVEMSQQDRLVLVHVVEPNLPNVASSSQYRRDCQVNTEGTNQSIRKDYQVNTEERKMARPQKSSRFGPRRQTQSARFVDPGSLQQQQSRTCNT